MDNVTIGAVIAVAILVFILTNQAAWKPVKWIGWAIGNLVIGSIILFLFNLMGESFSLTIPVNPVTATVTGFLGLPGLVTLIIIKRFIL